MINALSHTFTCLSRTSVELKTQIFCQYCKNIFFKINDENLVLRSDIRKASAQLDSKLEIPNATIEDLGKQLQEKELSHY